MFSLIFLTILLFPTYGWWKALFLALGVTSADHLVRMYAEYRRWAKEPTTPPWENQNQET